MAGEEAYKLVIGVYLQDKAAEGVKKVQESMEKLSKQAKTVQENFDKIGGNGAGARNVIAAQERINALVDKRVALNKQIAMTTDSASRTVLEAQKKAVSLAIEETTARKANLSLEEKTYAAALKFQDTQIKAIQKRFDAEMKLNKATNEWQAQAAKIESDNVRKRFEEQMRYNKANNAWQIQADKIEAAEKARLQKQLADGQIAQAQRVAKEHARVTSGASSAREAFGMGMGMFVAPAIAGAGFGALHTGIENAASLESLLRTMQIGTGASNGQVDQFRETAFTIANNTAQSATQSAQLMSVLASSGINDPKKLIALAPAIAKFADVQFLKRGTSFEDSAVQGVQLAHLFNAFDPASIDRVLNATTKASFMMPDSLNKFVTQAGYYMPTFKRMGVSDDQAIIAGTWLDRMGLGRGKGGTGLQNFIMSQMQALALTGHAQKGKKNALDALGLLNPDGTSKFYKDGHFDLVKSLEAINDSILRQTKGLTGHTKDAKEAKLITDIQSALGVTGGRVGLLGTPEAIHVLQDMIARFQDKRTMGMGQAQSAYMDTLNGQYNRAQTNWVSLLTDLMWPWIGSLKQAYRWLGDVTHAAQGWLHHNHAWAMGLSAAIGAISVAAGTFATIYGAGLVVSFITMGKTADKAAAAMMRAAGALEVIAERSAGIDAVAGGAAAKGGMGFAETMGFSSLAGAAAGVTAGAAFLGAETWLNNKADSGWEREWNKTMANDDRYAKNHRAAQKKPEQHAFTQVNHFHIHASDSKAVAKEVMAALNSHGAIGKDLPTQSRYTLAYTG